MLGARPTWNAAVDEEVRRPLWVVLDDSRSMGVVDDPPEGATTRPSGEARGGASRADVLNAALRESEGAIRRVCRLYDVRPVRLSETLDGTLAGTAAWDWQVTPSAPASPITATLRHVSEEAEQESAAGVLLLTDGAEANAAESDFREVAARVGTLGLPIEVIAFGPGVDGSPRIELEQLDVPKRADVHDQIHVVGEGVVVGGDNADVVLTMQWDGETVEQERVRCGPKERTFSTDWYAAPPGPGVHRLTLAARFADAAESPQFERDAIVEVTQGGIRVLLIEGAPRNETAFVTRALATSDVVTLDRLFLLPETSPLDSVSHVDADVWRRYDVVILGCVPRWRMTLDSLDALRERVATQGMGMLLAGGERLYEQAGFAGSAIAGMAPVTWSADGKNDAGPAGQADPEARLLPARGAMARRLLDIGEAGGGDSIWASLPPIGRATAFGDPKPLATTVATTTGGQSLLIAHEFGQGRVAAAGWEATWPWALSGERGAAWHRRFWRQMVGWLANRRPRAWVISDRSSYDALAGSAAARVRIRAGVTIPATTGAGADGGGLVNPTLRLVRSDDSEQPLDLTENGGEWESSLPLPGEGEYELHFSIARADGGPLEASTRFRVHRTDVELAPPTSRHDLLDVLAEETVGQGGAVNSVAEFRDVLGRWIDAYEPRTVKRAVTFDPMERRPWLLLILIAATFAAEWLLRKRVWSA
jgi:hypothetical protein